jgi:hypothetical protein
MKLATEHSAGIGWVLVDNDAEPENDEDPSFYRL